MSLDLFLEKIRNHEKVGFDDSMQIIAKSYDYQPVEFINGLADDQVVNPAGSNEGSCKIFAFAKINQLTEEQTLSLFGDYYWQEVLNDPHGSGHQNIRHFMKYGWAGIQFKGQALTAK